MEESRASTTSASIVVRSLKIDDVRCEWCAEKLCRKKAEFIVRIPGSRLWIYLCEEHFHAYRDFAGQVQFQRIRS